MYDEHQSLVPPTSSSSLPRKRGGGGDDSSDAADAKKAKSNTPIPAGPQPPQASPLRDFLRAWIPLRPPRPRLRGANNSNNHHSSSLHGRGSSGARGNGDNRATVTEITADMEITAILNNDLREIPVGRRLSFVLLMNSMNKSLKHKTIDTLYYFFKFRLFSLVSSQLVNQTTNMFHKEKKRNCKTHLTS